jgi:hypothetical protein
MSNTTTLVYQDTEVILTGRKALRETVSQTSRRQKQKIDTKVEITPADDSGGSWKKWVKLEELYTIKNTNEDN